jgi:hypothetical protein
MADTRLRRHERGAQTGDLLRLQEKLCVAGDQACHRADEIPEE